MVLWMLIIAASVAILAISAGAASGDKQMSYVHMAVTAAVCLSLALMAIREIRAAVVANESQPSIAAKSARFMGLVWTWGALALVVTYATGILSWKEWWHFFLAFFVAAGLSLFFSALLNKDARAGTQDDTILRIGRILAYVQFFGMLVVMIGLVIDNKMPPNLKARSGWEDWAANHIFFFGALALAAISAYAIRVQAPGRSTAHP
jgi:hypothetical protein